MTAQLKKKKWWIALDDTMITMNFQYSPSAEMFTAHEVKQIMFGQKTEGGLYGWIMFSIFGNKITSVWKSRLGWEEGCCWGLCIVFCMKQSWI